MLPGPRAVVAILNAVRMEFGGIIDCKCLTNGFHERIERAAILFGPGVRSDALQQPPVNLAGRL